MSSIGLLHAGGLDVALPLAALREVVPHPGVLDPLPVSAPGLLGSMRLRSSVLPVVDLGLLVHGEQATAAAARVVVVVAHEGRAVGVVVDEVRGVAHVDHDDLQQVTAAGTRLLVSHLVQHDGTSVSVLDPDALTSLPGVPTVAERAPAAATDGSDRPTDSTHAAHGAALTVVRCGDHRLALAIPDLRTTVPLAHVTPSLLTGGHCLGTTVHAGREVPVLDPLSLLGLDPLPRDGVSAGVVVPVADGEVVLAVTRLELLEHQPGAAMPVPASATRRSDLVRGVHRVGDDSCLVLDGDGLRADREVQAYAALGVDVVGAGGDVEERTASLTGPTCLSYAVGGAVVATPLAQVLEILPAPSALTPTRAPGVAGLQVHRGHTVTVVDLAAAVGREARVPAGCLLLLEVGGRHVGFTVDALRGIEPRTWTDPDARARPDGTPLDRSLETAPLVRLAGSDRLVPELDLHHVALTLLDCGATLDPIGACA